MSYANWLSVSYYLIGDIVVQNGNTYIAIANSYNVPPPNALFWANYSIGFQPSYAQLTSAASQSIPPGAVLDVQFDTKVVGTADISLIPAPPTTSVEVLTPGVYRVCFSIQIDKTGGGGADDFQFWFVQNGINVPNSNSEIDTNQNINQIMTIEVLLACAMGDVIGIRGFTNPTSANTQITAYPISPTRPVAIPSIILTLQRVG